MVADLEAKLAATRSEMDERIAISEKKTKEYNDRLDEAHQKYRNVVADHDVAVAELTKTHIQDTEGLRRTLKEAEMEIERLRTQIGTVREQMEEKAAEAEARVLLHKEQLAEAQQKLKGTCVENDKKVAEIIKKHEIQLDDLRHQLLAANLECDKIHTELASHQMHASPEDAVNIINRTMKSASMRGGKAPPKKNTLAIVTSFLRNSIGAIVVLMAVAYPLGLLSMDSVCAPVMPGTILATHDASSEAPWWAHDTMKADAFVICGDRPRTSLKWHGGRLVIADAETSKILFDKRSTTASIHGSVVNLYAKNSKIETLRPPWSI
jgi:small-conductance mechanosensitive channel